MDKGIRRIPSPDNEVQTIEKTRAPTSSDTAYPSGTVWVDSSTSKIYIHAGNGVWTEVGSGSGMTTQTKTDDYNVTTSDLGQSLRMNSASDKTFYLPPMGSSEDGGRITFIKQGSGKMTLDAADSDCIDDSTAGGTIYTTSLYATITLEYVDSMTRWVIISAYGIFTTT